MTVYVVDFGPESKHTSNVATVKTWVFATQAEAVAKAAEFDGDVVEIQL